MSQHWQTHRPVLSAGFALRFRFHRGLPYSSEPEPHRLAAARRDCERIMRRRLRPHALAIHRILSAVDDKIVDAIFDEFHFVPGRKQTLRIGFVLGEEKLRGTVAVQFVFAQRLVRRPDGWAMTEQIGARAETRQPSVFAPGPGVTKPDRGQHMKLRWLRPPI